MPEAIALLFADAHLSTSAWPGRGVYGDAYFSFEFIISEAIKRRVHLVGAGDLLNRQENRSEPVVQLYKQLDRLAEHNLLFYYIQGQHELEISPWLSAHPFTQHVDASSFCLGRFNVYGLDWRPAGKLQEALAQIPQDTDILISHQVWSEFMGSVANPQGGMADVPTVWMNFSGDLHECKTVSTRGKDGQEITLVSPGSTCMRAINEPADKYFALLFDDGSVEFEKIPTRPFVDWPVISADVGLDDCISRVLPVIADVTKKTDPRLPEELRKPLLRVTYNWRIDSTVRRVGQAVADTAFVFYKELPPERLIEPVASSLTPVDDLTSTTAQPSLTLESALPGYLAGKKAEHLSNVALRLLQAEDPDVELRRLRGEVLA